MGRQSKAAWKGRCDDDDADEEEFERELSDGRNRLRVSSNGNEKNDFG